MQWSVAGRVQRQRVLLTEESMVVDVAGLAAGSYLLRYATADGMSTLRFVKH